MENKRPKLSDPEEFAIVRQMYFKDHNPINDDIDPKERLERMEARQHNKHNESR